MIDRFAVIGASQRDQSVGHNIDIFDLLVYEWAKSLFWIFEKRYPCQNYVIIHDSALAARKPVFAGKHGTSL